MSRHPRVSTTTICAVAVLTCVSVLLGTRAPAAEAPTRAELVMGSLARITILDGASDAAFEAGFAALRAVDASMSLYRPESALVQVNAHAAEHAETVDADLFDCLARARALSVATDGAFDPTILPLLRAWGAYPGLTHVAAGRVDAVGWGGLLLDPSGRTVRFRRDGMGVDLGGIAKGFALDRAQAALVNAGARRALLDLGGEIALLGDGPGAGWQIAVTDPRVPATTLGVLTLGPNRHVSTSGNYARDFAAEGWRAHSHVFDPRTGRPARADLAVTVWASEGATADALSTAFLVTGRAGAAEMLARMPDVGVLFVDDAAAERLTILGAPPLHFEPNPPERLPQTASADSMETSR
jgi:thiamine biosynthesis lipoprotein